MVSGKIRRYAWALRNGHKKMGGLLIAVFFLVTIPESAIAARVVDRPDITEEAEIVSVRGEGWMLFVREEEWIDAIRGQILTSGDFVKTGSYGKMSILFIDDTQIKVHNRTTLLIKEVAIPGVKKRTILRLEIGEIWNRARPVPEGLRIETPSATAAIRGTDWDIVVDEQGTSYLTVLRGSVELFNPFGRVIVGPGEQAMAEVGKPPVKTFLVKPKERVQWIMPYPMDVVEFIPFYSHRRDEVLKLLPSVREKVEKDPSDLESRLLLARLLFDLRERDESLRLLEDVLKSDPRNGMALTFRGFIALGKGETEKAAFYFEEAVKNLPQGKRTKALLGMMGVLLSRDEIEKAAHLLDDIRRKDDSPIVGVITALFQAFQGNFTGAIETCSEFGSKYPADERFPILMASFYLKMDEGGKAKEAIDAALTINPRASWAYTYLGGFHYLEGRAKEAEEAFRKAIELDPKNPMARTAIGVVLMERGHYEESMEAHSKAVEINPNWWFYWSNRGVLFSLIEDLQRAEDDFKKALALDPANYVSLDGLGLIALKEGRTEEAIQYFLKSSLLEPKFAEPHFLLAVAYYQLGDVTKAFEELRLAEALDPRDPRIHTIANVIYQDIYRPFDAVKEAKKALELLPFLKSMDPFENTRAGLLNTGSALLGVGMSEWAQSYAQESFDPHNPSSHFYASMQYSGNLFVSSSEITQGFVLDPLSFSSPTRYQDIIRRPRHNLNTGTTVGDEDGGFSQLYNATLQGYVREPWETSYYLFAEHHDNEGFRANGFSRGYRVLYGIGSKPNFKNGFSIWGWGDLEKEGKPGSITNPDPDDREENSEFYLSVAHRYRLGRKNNLLTRFAYVRTEKEFKNPAPFGTGLTDTQISFIMASMFGLFDEDTARGFFEKGIYDVTALFAWPNTALATDSTGTLDFFGLEPFPSTFPPLTDDDPKHREKTHKETLTFQTRHLFDMGDRHQVTYGLEYIPIRERKRTVSTALSSIGRIDFCDELFLPTMECYFFPEVESSIASTESSNRGRFQVAYIDERWRPAPGWLIEVGAFYESHKDNFNDYNELHPRVGLAVNLGTDHVLRMGFQKWLQPDIDIGGTLAPVSTAGLVVDNSLALIGTRLTDYQARFESRWSDRFFTAIGTERVELKDPDLGPGFTSREGRINHLTAAINTILTRETGAFIRYRFSDSKNTAAEYRGRGLPLSPKRTFGAGLVWVSPLHIKAMLSTSYVGKQPGNLANTVTIDDYWITNFSATWEPFKKRVMVSLAVNNIFDKQYETLSGFPAAGRSAFISVEYRF